MFRLERGQRRSGRGPFAASLWIARQPDGPAGSVRGHEAQQQQPQAGADDEEKKAEIIVSEQQLSLAIGKSGQNVRLAAKLTGFGIDIKSEAQANEDIDETAGDEEDVELTLSEEE